jgi:hypothetical protein
MGYEVFCSVYRNSNLKIEVLKYKNQLLIELESFMKLIGVENKDLIYNELQEDREKENKDSPPWVKILDEEKKVIGVTFYGAHHLILKHVVEERKAELFKFFHKNFIEPSLASGHCLNGIFISFDDVEEKDKVLEYLIKEKEQKSKEIFQQVVDNERLERHSLLRLVDKNNWYSLNNVHEIFEKKFNIKVDAETFYRSIFKNFLLDTNGRKILGDYDKRFFKVTTKKDFIDFNIVVVYSFFVSEEGLVYIHRKLLMGEFL